MGEGAPERPGFDAGSFARGLWRRLRDVILVAERVEHYAFGGAAEPGRRALAEGEAGELATEFVLRALRAAGDRTSWRILARAAEPPQGAALEDLAAELGIPRLAVAERANDLLQSGLVARALDADRVVATQAGIELVALVRETAAALAAEAERPAGALRDGHEEGGERRGLPLL